MDASETASVERRMEAPWVMVRIEPKHDAR
jgi:hypothetical protein